MNEKELDELLETNLAIAFTNFEKVSENGSIKDNGNTQRIMDLIKEDATYAPKAK